MINLTRVELKLVIKEAVREVLAESELSRWSNRPAILTLEQIAAIEKRHIVTVRNRARLGKIPGAKEIGGEWRVATAKYERHLGFAPGTMPIPKSNKSRVKKRTSRSRSGT